MQVLYLDGCPCCGCCGSVEVQAHYAEGAQWSDPWTITGLVFTWYEDSGQAAGNTNIPAGSIAATIPNLPLSFPNNQVPRTGDTLSLILGVDLTYQLSCGTVTLPEDTPLEFSFTRGWAGSTGWYATRKMVVCDGGVG